MSWHFPVLPMSWHLRTTDYFRLNFPQEPFHLDRRPNVDALADLLESIMSLDGKLDRVILDLDDLCSRGDLCSDRCCREVLYIHHDPHCNPTLRQVFSYRRFSRYFQVVDHYWRAVHLGHVFVEMS